MSEGSNRSVSGRMEAVARDEQAHFVTILNFFAPVPPAGRLSSAQDGSPGEAPLIEIQSRQGRHGPTPSNLHSFLFINRNPKE